MMEGNISYDCCCHLFGTCAKGYKHQPPRHDMTRQWLGASELPFSQSNEMPPSCHSPGWELIKRLP